MSTWDSTLWGLVLPGGAATATGSGFITTAKTLIQDALRELTVLRPGQGASTDELDECLRQLNLLLDSWSTERLTLPALARMALTLTPGKLEYIVGPGCDLDASRPQQLWYASIIRAGETEETPVPIIANAGEWSHGKEGVWLDGSAPESVLRIRPTPEDADGLILYAWMPHALFAGLDAPYALPPGYALALQFCLALQLGPRYSIAQFQKGAPLYDHIFRQATSAKARIKAANAPTLTMRCDEALLRM